MKRLSVLFLVFGKKAAQPRSASPWFVKTRILTLVFLLLVGMPFMQAQTDFRIEVLSGPVYNFPTELEVYQEGYGHWSQMAEYRTEPFKLPPYYDLRGTIWLKNKIGIGVKFTHHKLILDNPKEPIQFFEITHGFNLATAALIYNLKYLNLNLGLGTVVAHPQSTIRQVPYRRSGFWQGGYVVTGLATELGISKYITLWKNLYLTTEFRWTYGKVKVPVHLGYARASNSAVHGLVGLGYKLIRFKKKGEKCLDSDSSD